MSMLRKFFNHLRQLELIIPMSISFISAIFLSVHTSLYNPYTIEIQMLVFIGVIIFNLCIMKFYENERKISFMFFVLNSLLIFTYIRLSLIYPSIYISLIYYFVIFLGFHIFENTFTKRFYLRTKIIFKGYYNESQYIKIILWFLLIFIPSLISYPLVMITVCQPLMLFLHLFEYDKIFLFFSTILLWCFLLFLLNRYRIGLNFLKNCKNYFSRRACLHYIGNTFGSCVA